jgi:hypothetical protein
MKNLRILYTGPAVLAGLAGLMGCHKDATATPSVAAAFSQPVSLRLQQPGAYPSLQAPELTLVVAEANDYRCPLGVTCAWAGEVRVALTVADERGIRQSVPLRLSGLTTAADSTVVAANGSRYLVVLHEVRPYPNASAPAPPQDQRFVFTVKRQ